MLTAHDGSGSPRTHHRSGAGNTTLCSGARALQTFASARRLPRIVRARRRVPRKCRTLPFWRPAVLVEAECGSTPALGSLFPCGGFKGRAHRPCFFDERHRIVQGFLRRMGSDAHQWAHPKGAVAQAAAPLRCGMAFAGQLQQGPHFGIASLCCSTVGGSNPPRRATARRSVAPSAAAGVAGRMRLAPA